MTARAALLEKDFTGQVLDLAKIFGWRRAHFRAALTKHGWRTPVQGDGAGWPDLILVRPPRFVVAELKTDIGIVEDDQAVWLDELGRCTGVESYVWRPKDFDRITDLLRPDRTRSVA